MEKSTAEFYQLTSDEESNGHQAVVLRSIGGDPRRHKPLVAHPRSTKTTTPTTMYVMEARQTPLSTKKSDNKKRSNVTPTIYLEPQIISQPVIYSIAGAKSVNKTEPSTTKNQTLIPSSVQRPRRSTIDLTSDESSTITGPTNRTPTIYSIVDTPLLQPPLSTQLTTPATSFYSVSNTPTRKSRGTQVEFTTPSEPVPVLYTIVGDTPTSRDSNSQDFASTRRNDNTNNDRVVYVPTNEVYSSKSPQSTMYTLVGKAESPPDINVTRASPIVVYTKPYQSRDIETIQESVIEDFDESSVTHTSHGLTINDNNDSKPEPIFIPMHDEPKRQTGYQPTTMASNRSSSHGFRTQKPHRERKLNQTPLPVVSNTRQERRTQINPQESRYRSDRYFPNGYNKSTSLERNQVRAHTHSQMWEGEQQAQTDDDEPYEKKFTRINRPIRLVRHRQPWIPVW